MPGRVLLIQDYRASGNLLREAVDSSLEKHFQVEWVTSCCAGLARLTEGASRGEPARNGIVAIVLDLFLPDSRGIETFERIIAAAPQIPILILGNLEDEPLAKLAVQRGAQDYLLKARLDDYLLLKTLRSMIERASIAESLFEEKERAQVTLNSIGDAVISTDIGNRIIYVNAVAESMTGWRRNEALGRPVTDVLRLIDADSRAEVRDPMSRAMRENKIVELVSRCILIRRDGSEVAIDDSAAPIHDRRGQVIGAVIVFHDVSTARAVALRMTYLAQHDGLTDLPNRTLLKDRLTQSISFARRNHRKLAVLFLDVDRFKHVNDSFGHAIGDRLLQSVARRLLGCVRASDTISRQGGDEFVVLLAEVAHPADAAVSAEKMLVALSAPHEIERQDVCVTVSIGIATYPDDGIEAEELMKHADFAMYHAKDCGRNNYQFFMSDLNMCAEQRQSVENDLRHAIQKRQFVLHYQPMISLATGAVTGVEALIRWYHPGRGLVPTAQFIPVAEESGFIVPIGRWVLREACRQARAWKDAGLPLRRIAINVSTVELRQRDFVTAVAGALMESGLQAECLEVELTETFLMQDTTSTAVVLQELKKLGVQLALDDFGTGYSSLSYLKHFPIDVLKIDQSFVHDITINPDAASIVSAVIGMGKSLNMRVVAEGVETPEQLAFLHERACPEAQGFYFSPAVAGPELAGVLENYAHVPPRRAAKNPTVAV